MNILGVGCAARIVHNALQRSADVVPIDVESIINKVSQHFHAFIVTVEALKSFCSFVEVEYKQVLGSVKTRWLSMLPTVEGMIEMLYGHR